MCIASFALFLFRENRERFKTFLTLISRPPRPRGQRRGLRFVTQRGRPNYTPRSAMPCERLNKCSQWLESLKPKYNIGCLWQSTTSYARDRFPVLPTCVYVTEFCLSTKAPSGHIRLREEKAKTKQSTTAVRA